MNTVYDVTVDSHDVERMLERVEGALSPEGLAKFLQVEVGSYLQTRAKQIFGDEGGDAVGGKWLPLHPATVLIRQQQQFAAYGIGGEHPINVRTGEMERWVTGDPGIASPVPGFGAMLKFPGSSMSSSVREKVETAQRGKGRTPARPVLGVSDADFLAVVTRLSFFIQGMSAV